VEMGTVGYTHLYESSPLGGQKSAERGQEYYGLFPQYVSVELGQCYSFIKRVNSLVQILQTRVLKVNLIVLFSLN